MRSGLWARPRRFAAGARLFASPDEADYIPAAHDKRSRHDKHPSPYVFPEEGRAQYGLLYAFGAKNIRIVGGTEPHQEPDMSFCDFWTRLVTGVREAAEYAARFGFTENWSAFATFRALFLDKEVTNSPMVETSEKYTIGLGLMYGF